MPKSAELKIRRQGGAVRYRTIKKPDGTTMKCAVTRKQGPQGGKTVCWEARSVAQRALSEKTGIDAHELKIGAEEERTEHGMAPRVALRTARQHLKQHKRYYTGLKAAEKKGMLDSARRVPAPYALLHENSLFFVGDTACQKVNDSVYIDLNTCTARSAFQLGQVSAAVLTCQGSHPRA